jgi:long-subunit fatty acid transport protein
LQVANEKGRIDPLWVGLFQFFARECALFYEIGTEDVGLAGAGQAARAQDASTIVTNPAGMTRLPDHMFTGECRSWAAISLIS